MSLIIATGSNLDHPIKNLEEAKLILANKFDLPRIIDMDIVFWGLETHHTKLVTIPHPRWPERSFVIRPLQELPFFKTIEKCFTIPKSFQVEAYPV